MNRTGQKIGNEHDQRIAAARWRIESVQRELRRWEPVNGQTSHGHFSPQIHLLQQALDLLDPEVKLA